MEDIRTTLGRNLVALRRRRDLTQEGLEAMTGVSQQYLSGLESGARNPTIATLQKIALALEVEPAELLRSQPSED